MTSQGCTPDNAMGAFISMLENMGKELDPSYVTNKLDDGGKASYVKRDNMLDAQVYNESVGDEPGLANVKTWTGDPGNAVKKISMELRNPSGLVGEDRIAANISFQAEHFGKYGSDLNAGKKEYFDRIDGILDSLPTNGLTDSQKAFLEHRYKPFYRSGGEFYGKAADRGTVTKAVSNLTGNVIKSSPTVIVGNVFEGAVKLPTLYPESFMQGIAKASERGLFKMDPELAKQGVYGVVETGDLLGRQKSLIGLTDVPLKNIAYWAGELRDGAGGGSRAVQNVAFIPRFGDLPAVYHSTGGRLAVQFLGYTINTYKMYGQMWKDLFTPGKTQQALQSLATFHAMTGLIGGVGAMLPEPIEATVKSAFPETEQFFEDNKTMLANLIQPGNIDNVGIGFNIASSQVQRAERGIQKGVNKISQGDPLAVLDFAEAGLAAAMFGNGIVGDAQLQRMFRTAKKIATDEIPLDDTEAIAEEVVPFL